MGGDLGVTAGNSLPQNLRWGRPMLTSTQYLGFRSVSTVLLTVKLLSTVIALPGKARSNDDNYD